MNNRLVEVCIKDTQGKYKKQILEWMTEEEAEELFGMLRKKVSNFMQVADSERLARTREGEI